MYEIAYSQGARKSLKRKRSSGLFSDEAFLELVRLLAIGDTLPVRFNDHALHGDLRDSRECHLGFDLLVIYKRTEALRIVTIQDVGTHAEVFGD